MKGSTWAAKASRPTLATTDYKLPPKQKKVIEIKQPPPDFSSTGGSSNSSSSKENTPSRNGHQKYGGDNRCRADSDDDNESSGVILSLGVYEASARAIEIPHGINQSDTNLLANGRDQPINLASSKTPSSKAITQNKTNPYSRSSLDIYAHKYVPYWLECVNESFANVVSAPFLQRIDFQLYRNSFVGIDYQQSLPFVELPPQQPCVLNSIDVHLSTYELYWQQRLQNEYASHAYQNVGFRLFQTYVRVQDVSQHLYRFKFPGIRENNPRVDLGDVLFLRPLVPVLQNTIGQEALMWSQHRDCLAPGFLGEEHHTVVWSILRRDETVVVRLGKPILALHGTAKVNVIIPLQADKGAPAWQAISLAQSNLDSNTSGKLWLSSMLFPEPQHGTIQQALPKGAFSLQWYDMSLNVEQKRAVQAVVDAEYGQVPYLISGPPGTGKTKTVVETALQLLQTQKSLTPHLLICAPSDAAADTLLVRLSAYMLQKTLFRLNSWMRLTAEVPGEVRPYCYMDTNQLYSLPPFETLMGYHVVISTCRDASMLISAGLTNHALTSVTTSLMRAIAPTAVDKGRIVHWTALLLDEAAQATEPEVLIPLSVIAPLTVDASRPVFTPQVVMAGDEHQLGPRLISAAVSAPTGTFDTQGLEKSLFQRLFERPLYRDHPLSRANGLRPLNKKMLPIIRAPFADLIRNYRSHPAILATSSFLFYADTLIAERPKASGAILSWPGWVKKSNTSSTWPVIFHQNSSPDAVESILEGDGTGSGNLTNHGEASIALHTTQSLLDHINNTSTTDHLHPSDIIVMSPYSAQVSYLRTLFRSHALHDVRIGPLEAFQGLESRIVILCTTRTRAGQHPHPYAKYVSEDRARNLGVIEEPKRFNVAMTRAKEALVVIGHAEVLSCTRDSCWINFLRFCLRNGLCTGGSMGWIARKDVGRGGEKVGKLEGALRYADGLKGSSGDWDDGGNAAGDELNGNRHGPGFRLRGKMVGLDEEMLQLQVGEEEAEKIWEEERDEDDHRDDKENDSNDIEEVGNGTEDEESGNEA